MDAPVIAAIITGPLSFLGAGLGVLVSGKHEVTKQRWELIHKAIADLHGDNVALSDDAQGHLDDLVRYEALSRTQRAWIRNSLRTFIDTKRRGSVGGA